MTGEVGVGKGYSLWLVQDHADPWFDWLQQCILALGWMYRTPIFIPHVTLLADLQLDEAEVLSKAEAFAHRLEPIPITLSELGSNDYYFQRLFGSVDMTPQLLAAHEAALQQFGAPPKGYFPHVSLLYGDLTPKQVAERQEVVRKSTPKVEGMDILLVNLEVWDTRGRVHEWKPVATIQLGQ